MTTTTIEQNIIYGLGEGSSVADTTMLSYSLRWANAAYREIFNRYQPANLRKRVLFKTSDGQSMYQVPSDLWGFIVVKDETNDSIIDQITPEEFAGKISTTQVTDESFTSSYDVAVSLDNTGIVQHSETVTTTDGLTTYVRDTDYTFDYSDGSITVDSTGSMSDATAYEIDYLYYAKGDPTKYCLEYDATNEKYIIRLDPVPDSELVVSNLYEYFPNDLSSSVDPIWNRFEFALERGGIYYGSLEIIDDAQKRVEFKTSYEAAIQAMIQLDQGLQPKHQQIQLKMKKSDYQSWE